MIIRRLLRCPGAKRIPRERKVSTTLVQIWTRCFLVVREQEFEGTSVSGCRRGDDEVEDGAEVVGRDEGFFG